MFPQTPTSIYQTPNCFITYGTMGHVDLNQAPSRGKPWNAILAQDFIHKVDLIVPTRIKEILQQKLVAERCAPTYSRLTMTLADILSGDFFTEYIKKGNILMLSEGKTTVGNMFTLQEGTLTMYLDKETYERAGLMGKPYSVKGGRGMRPRWIVSYDLRSPAMLHGKKGFDRLVYASKNILGKPATWLFCNVAESTPSPDPLLKYFPTQFTSSPGVSRDLVVLQPPLDIHADILTNGDRTALEEAATECYEWLSLVRLGSPRVERHDDIDPYLSRYRIPGGNEEQVTVCQLTWQGFMSTYWLRSLLIDTLITCPAGSWFSLSATCFSKSVLGNCDEFVLLQPPSAPGQYLMWETKSSD